jgi:hypothetical protein
MACAPLALGDASKWRRTQHWPNSHYGDRRHRRCRRTAIKRHPDTCQRDREVYAVPASVNFAANIIPVGPPPTITTACSAIFPPCFLGACHETTPPYRPAVFDTEIICVLSERQSPTQPSKSQRVIRRRPGACRRDRVTPPGAAMPRCGQMTLPVDSTDQDLRAHSNSTSASSSPPQKSPRGCLPHAYRASEPHQSRIRAASAQRSRSVVDSACGGRAAIPSVARTDSPTPTTKWALRCERISWNMINVSSAE